MYDSLWPYGLESAKFVCPWDPPGENTGVDYYAFLQEIFPNNRLNQHLLLQADSLPSEPPGNLHYTIGQWIWEKSCWRRNRDFIHKVSRVRRWCTYVPKNHLAWARIRFLLLKGKGLKSLFYTVLISSFLQWFAGGPCQAVSCELNKGILT